MAGNRFSMSGLRACKNSEGRRHPPPDSGMKSFGSRAPPSPRAASHGASRARPGQSGRKVVNPSPPLKGSVMTGGHDERKDLGKRSGDDARKKSEVVDATTSKKGRSEGHGVSIPDHGFSAFFVSGVNSKDNAGSFWDPTDLAIGMQKGKGFVSEFDTQHLISQPCSSLIDFMALHGCQAVSVALALKAQEERSRLAQDKLCEEVTKLKEECRRLETKSKETSTCFQNKLDVKIKECKALRQECKALEEKYSAELSTGSLFLNSPAGVAFLSSKKDEILESFRASEAFADEVYRGALSLHDDIVRDCRHQLRVTGLVPEEVLMMIEPDVPELVAVPRIEGAGDLPGLDGDIEIIEELNSLQGDDANDDA